MTASTRRLPAPPATPEDLSLDERRRLARAERRIASADRAQAAAAQREIAEVALRHGARVEAVNLAARLAETAKLARARGEQVRAEQVRISSPLVDKHGARLVKDGQPLYRQETVSRIRVVSRGGLQLAFERGDLDGGPVKAEALLQTGKVYRSAFETCASMTTPQRNLATVSVRAPLRASAGPQDAVFAAGETLRLMRRALSERHLAVLDLVCGLDLTLSGAGAAIRADPRTVRKALLEGLTLAAATRRQARHDESVQDDDVARSARR